MQDIFLTEGRNQVASVINSLFPLHSRNVEIHASPLKRNRKQDFFNFLQQNRVSVEKKRVRFEK